MMEFSTTSFSYPMRTVAGKVDCFLKIKRLDFCYENFLFPSTSAKKSIKNKFLKFLQIAFESFLQEHACNTQAKQFMDPMCSDVFVRKLDFPVNSVIGRGFDNDRIEAHFEVVNI